MITYRLHLIRCGQAYSDGVPRYTGQSDPPLCAAGREKLALLKESFSYPRADAVYTSSLRRCVETAEILYPDAYTVESDDLRDLCLGEFEGKTAEELKNSPAFADWMSDSLRNTPPGGEEIADFVNRLISAAGLIFADMMERKLSSVALITHRGAISALLSAIGQPKRPVYEWLAENGRGYTLLMSPQMWMRDGSSEIFDVVPGKKTRGSGYPD